MPSPTSWISLLVLTACAAGPASGPGDDAVAATPSAPGPLEVTGSLRNIHLRWTASAGAAGYHVYRSADGAAFSRLTGAPVTGTSYDDPIESPAGDGVLYRYQVTAVDALYRDRVTAGGAVESAFSNIAGTMHGTRLEGPYLPYTKPAESPYVAEGITVFLSTVRVQKDTKLYVLAGAVLDFETDSGTGFEVHGLIRATGATSAPAVFTAHARGGGALVDGQGLWFYFDGVGYDPRDGSGSMLDHVQVDHLATDPTGDGGMVLEYTGLSSTGIKLRDVKLSGASLDGSTCLLVKSWVILEYSFLDRVALCIDWPMGNTPLQVTHNVFRHAPIFVERNTPRPAGPGQIVDNDLDGVEGVWSDGESLPLGGNYWAGAGGAPPVPSGSRGQGSAADFNNPGPALAEPPTAGPDW
jgi:hypothetical protein